MPEVLREGESVHLTDWPVLDLSALDADKLRSDYEIVRRVRESVTKAIEDARNAGEVAFVLLYKRLYGLVHIAQDASAYTNGQAARAARIGGVDNGVGGLLGG